MATSAQSVTNLPLSSPLASCLRLINTTTESRLDRFVVCKMLCAVCLSMFAKEEASGTHHTCLKNLQRAAEGGCRICTALVLRRDTFGPDPEAEKTATPFLQYRWESDSVRCEASLEGDLRFWEISFDSNIRWMARWGASPWNHVRLHMSHSSEPVPEWYLNVSQHAAKDLDSAPWMVRRELFPLRPIPDNTGDKRALDIAKIWLENCDRSHDCGKLNSTLGSEWYPKRLIDVTNAASPRLFETHSEPPLSRYATLSHCWGSNPDFITLTTENYTDFCKGIPVDTLPKSFRDAIAICDHLDIRYIWIDSLCILQDSHPDWLMHAAEMASVYQNCYLNLSFDIAANPRQGAFTGRNTDVLQECCAFSTIPRNPNLRRMIIGDSSSSDGSFAGSVSDDTSDIPHSGGQTNEGRPDEEVSVEGDPAKAAAATKYLVLAPLIDIQVRSEAFPLSRRGWVVQERLLSSRRLHFAGDRIRWECEDGSLHEGHPHKLPKTGNLRQWYEGEHHCFPERYPERSKWDHFENWEEIVSFYSACFLTYPDKDKLVALAAVAQRFAAVFGEEYYAGHFRENMPFDLTWRVLRRHPGQDASIRRHPTWSWASVDAEVGVASIGSEFKQSLAIVEGVNVTLEDPSYRYGPANECQLILRCLAAKCEIGTIRDPWRGEDPWSATRQVHLQDKGGDNNCSVQTYLDVLMDVPEQELSKETFLVPLAERAVDSQGDTRAVMGIMLLRQPDGFYTRIGFWNSDPMDFNNLENRPLFDYIDRHSQNHQQVMIV